MRLLDVQRPVSFALAAIDQSLLEELEITKNLSIQVEDNTVTVEVANHIFKDARARGGHLIIRASR